MSDQRIPVARDVYKLKVADADPVEVVVVRVRPPKVTFKMPDGHIATWRFRTFFPLADLLRASPIADLPAEERARTGPAEPEPEAVALNPALPKGTWTETFR